MDVLEFVTSLDHPSTNVNMGSPLNAARLIDYICVGFFFSGTLESQWSRR